MDPNPNISSAASVWSDQTPSTAIHIGSFRFLTLLQMWWLLFFTFFFFILFFVFAFSKMFFAFLLHFGCLFKFFIMRVTLIHDWHSSHIIVHTVMDLNIINDRQSWNFRSFVSLKKKADLFHYFCRIRHWLSSALSSLKFLWLAGWFHVSLHKFLCLSFCAPGETLVTLWWLFICLSEWLH